MSSGDFRIVQTTDDREIIASFQRQQQEIIKLLGKFSELKVKGNEAGQSWGGAMGTAVAGFGRLAGALTGIGSVIGGILAAAAQVRREYDNIINRQERHNQERKTYEESIGDLTLNFAAYMNAAQLDTKTRQMAKAAGVTPEVAANALSASVSKASPQSAQEASDLFESVQAALEFNPGMDTGDRTAFSEAITLFRKTVQEETGQRISGQQAAGFIIATAGMAPAKDLGTVSDNAVPAINDLVRKGFTPQQASAMTTTMAAKSGDSEMARSGNAIRDLAGSLQDVFGDRFPDMEPMARMKMVADDPQLRKEFLYGAKGIPALTLEQKNKQTAFDMMTPGTTAYESTFAGIREMKNFAANAELYSNMQADIKSIMPVTATGKALGANTSQIATNDVAGAIAAEMRKQEKDFLQSMGDSDMSQRVDKFSFDFNGGLSEEGSVPYLIERYKRRAKRLRSPFELMPGFGMDSPPQRVEREPTAAELEKAGQFEERAALYEQKQRDYQAQYPEAFTPPETIPPTVRRPVAPIDDAGKPQAAATSVETVAPMARVTSAHADRAAQPGAAASGSDFGQVASAIFALIDRLDRHPQAVPPPVPNVNVNVATNDRPADRNFAPRTIRPTRSAGLDRRRLS